MAIAAASIGLTAHADAATVVWNTPTNDTGKAGDVVATGTLVAARTIGQTTTVNGVAFTSGFSGSMKLSGVDATGALGALSFADASYNALVGTGAYTHRNSAAQMSIEMTGLTIGTSYLFQAFTPFWNLNWATTFTGGANTSGLVNLSGGDYGAGSSLVAQNVVGNFTADSTTQRITLASPTEYSLIAAAQLRTAEVMQAVPEPATWAMMLVGFAMVGAATRHRRRSITPSRA